MSGIDFAQVRADDAAIDAIAAGHQPEQADDVSQILLAWRNAVDAVPIRELVSPRIATATVRAAIARRRRGSCA